MCYKLINLILICKICVAEHIFNYFDNEVPPLFVNEFNNISPPTNVVVPVYNNVRRPLTYYESSVINRKKNPNILRAQNTAYFQALDGYAVGSKNLRNVADYTWLGKVVHSPDHTEPYICTAACIYNRTFLVPARCLATLKVNQTTVMYNSLLFPVKAFVLPTNYSQQWFDDLAFVVVEAGKYEGVWNMIHFMKEIQKRTDHEFKWFADLDLSRYTFHVVGYAIRKYQVKVRTHSTPFYPKVLYNLIVDINLCHMILGNGHVPNGYMVPCFHSCTVDQFEKTDPQCSKYLGTEGGLLLNHKYELLGVSTWGTRTSARAVNEMPVGFSVPNQFNYYEDFECAKKVSGILKREFIYTKGHMNEMCRLKIRI